MPVACIKCCGFGPSILNIATCLHAHAHTGRHTHTCTHSLSHSKAKIYVQRVFSVSHECICLFHWKNSSLSHTHAPSAHTLANTHAHTPATIHTHRHTHTCTQIHSALCSTCPSENPEHQKLDPLFHTLAFALQQTYLEHTHTHTHMHTHTHTHTHTHNPPPFSTKFIQNILNISVQCSGILNTAPAPQLDRPESVSQTAVTCFLLKLPTLLLLLQLPSLKLHAFWDPPEIVVCVCVCVCVCV